MDAFRTPEERFTDIPDFPYGPRYREWQGLRLAHLDEGNESRPAIVLLHGEPTWSYLWRKVMGPLLEAGHRCVVPDLPGFGRSDKPTDPAWYSYGRHTAALTDLFETLDLRAVTLVVHDWGGPIGLRAATLSVPERVSRFVVMDTGVFDGRQRMTDDWLRFKAFVKWSPALPIKRLVRAGCHGTPTDETLAAYKAPFPTEGSKAGARTFPEMIPLAPEEEGADAGASVKEALLSSRRPALVFWGDSDRVLPLESAGREMAKLMTGSESLTTVEGAGHFLQEDRGEFIGEEITRWLASG
ncbi:haloalkane dehalogenase [Rubrobacter indicoceani]|uniref:haloalkane dehalogenase n=1 Tax=Rubrobacter indicoceani TaxID=2051957 RepID=UPI000E5A9EAD|nr:haloalkane dehalogenase [Rubrobacter indicoceani]